MNPLSLLNLVSSFIFVSLGIYGYNTGKLEPESRIYRLFLLLCLCFSIWGFTFAFLHSATLKNEIELWYNISSIGWCMFGGVGIHLFLLMAKKESILKKKWIYAVIYAPGIIFTMKEFTGVLYSIDFIRIGYGYSEVPHAGGIWFWLFVIHQTGCEICGLFLLFLWGRRSRIQREKKQAKTMIITTSISLVLAFTSDILLPLLNIFIVPALSPLFLLIWGYGIWYSISRYKFMSVNRAFTSDEIASRMKDLFFLVSPDGTVLKINHQVADLLGVDEKKVTRMPFPAIFTNGDAISGEFHSLIENNASTFETENEVTTAAGERIPLKIHGSMLRDKFGDPISVIVIAIDLREKIQLLRETEERVRSEERYRTIFDSNKANYFEVDLAGNMTFFNDVVCEFMGYPREELQGLNFSKFVSEETIARVFGVYNGVFRGAAKVGFVEHDIIHKGGGIRWVDSSVSLLRGTDGSPAGFRCLAIDITERKKIEAQREAALEALRESEERYRIVIDNINDAIFIAGLDGHLKYMSLTIVRISGCPAEDMLGRHFLHYIHPDYRTRELELYRDQVEKNIEISAHEYPFLREDGSTVWVGQTVRMVKNREGELEFFGVLRDISERKAAEQALREGEEKYRHFIENANDVIYKADWRGNFIFANEAFTRLFGYTKDELLRLNYLDLIVPERRDEEFAYYSGQLKNRVAESFRELPVLAKNGEVKWIEQSVKSIFNKDGRISEFDAIVRDITDRKKAEDALRESEERHRLTLENVEDGVFICGADGRFTYVNNAVIRFSGYTMEELLSKSYLHFFHRDDRERELQSYIRQINEDIPITYHEYRFNTKSGSIIWISQTTRMVKDRDGKIEFYGVARDITEKKETEQARIELEKQKSRFFTNISHEIHTPLTLMLSPIESYLQGDYPKEIGRDFFEALYRNGLQLLKLINNLLDFSKLEAGRMTMKVAGIDIVRFTRNYVSTIQSACDSRGLTLEFIPPRKVPNLYADPEKIDKVLMNLLSNALKFTDAGGKITVRIRDDEVFCYLDIEDTGQGIPGASLDTIFERFGQAETAVTRKHPGTGIGLALAKELVEMHGGTITVQSRFIEDHPEDHGSVFTVTLLKGKEHLEGQAGVTFGKEEEEGGDAMTGHRFAGMREMDDMKKRVPAGPGALRGDGGTDPAGRPAVLIVDDNPDMRDYLGALMKDKYNIAMAENGVDGLATIERQAPDLVITDVMMPVMDGYEMTRRIKRDEKMKYTPVIMLTAKADISQKIDGLESGADDYLTKPFNSMELLARVKTLIKTREYERAISRRNSEIEQELEVARMLQLRLLPDGKPEIHGFDFHFTYLPMDLVGGDFYDWRSGDGVLELFIADVSGHGLPGAFLASITKTALRSIDGPLAADRVLARLNGVVHRSTVLGNYVTAFLCRIDTATREMKYSSAGHWPLYVHRADTETIIELGTKGRPLGWFPDTGFEEKSFTLRGGDRIILYTDGIPECVNARKEIFGEDRFKDFIKRHRALAPEEFSNRLVARLKDFSHSVTLEDDLTMAVFDIV